MSAPTRKPSRSPYMKNPVIRSIRVALIAMMAIITSHVVTPIGVRTRPWVSRITASTRAKTGQSR